MSEEEMIVEVHEYDANAQQLDYVVRHACTFPLFLFGLVHLGLVHDVAGSSERCVCLAHAARATCRTVCALTHPPCAGTRNFFCFFIFS